MKLTTIHTLLLLTAAFCASAAASEQKRVAITIDDVPFAATTPITVEEAAALNRMILDTLKRHNVKAVGFVNEDRLLIPGKLDAGVAILDEWLDAGMELGNHNFGHVGLWKSSLAENQEAVLKGEVLTRWASVRKGSPFRYYRHPYTQTGKDEDEKQAFEAFLASHGYTVAPFTMEHDDYVFACVYEHVPARGSERDAQRAAVVSEYDAHLRQSVETFEDMSDQLFGRQIPQVFLLHASRRWTGPCPRWAIWATSSYLWKKPCKTTPTAPQRRQAVNSDPHGWLVGRAPRVSNSLLTGKPTRAAAPLNSMRSFAQSSSGAAQRIIQADCRSEA
jgi:peptidoglycan/xylan/chitin deacetylase (PgdA/CDA1 family)